MLLRLARLAASLGSPAEVSPLLSLRGAAGRSHVRAPPRPPPQATASKSPPPPSQPTEVEEGDISGRVGPYDREDRRQEPNPRAFFQRAPPARTPASTFVKSLRNSETHHPLHPNSARRRAEGLQRPRARRAGAAGCLPGPGARC
jgi:hypothetical protein